MFSERTQILLTPTQRRLLERIAADRHISVGALVREAIDTYLGRNGRPKSEALQTLLGLQAPIGDWEIMKTEIIQGATGDGVR